MTTVYGCPAYSGEYTVTHPTNPPNNNNNNNNNNNILKTFPCFPARLVITAVCL